MVLRYAYLMGMLALTSLSIQPTLIKIVLSGCFIMTLVSKDIYHWEYAMSKHLNSRPESYHGAHDTSPVDKKGYPLQIDRGVAPGDTHDALTRSASDDARDVAMGVSPIRPPHTTKRKKKGSLLSKIMLIVGVLLLIVALVGFGSIWLQYKQGRDMYTAVQQTGGVTSETVTTAAQTDTGTLAVDWASLSAQNSDIVGWLAVPGLDDVNYPVVQTDNNATYLRTGFDGTYSINGCIFMDMASAADLSDLHTVIYGHHMNDGSMFAQLADYTDATFFKAHSTIIYVTPTKTYHLTVIAAYAALENADMRTTSFMSQAEWTAYVQDILDKATVTDGTTTSSDVTHLFSFITCSYAEKDDRTVVLAIETPTT